MIDACLFDMDGLLLDSERVGMAVFRDLTRAEGLTADRSDALYRSVVGTSSEVTFARVAEALPETDVRALDAAWHEGLAAALAEGAPLRPGVADALARVAERGLPMVVVTTTRTDRARTHLASAGILAFFADVVGRDRQPAPKPDPAPYLMGAEIAGVAPGRCAAFEDSDTGTRAAVAAGCLTWQVPDLRPHGVAFPSLGQTIVQDLTAAVAHALELRRVSEA